MILFDLKHIYNECLSCEKLADRRRCYTVLCFLIGVQDTAESTIGVFKTILEEMTGYKRNRTFVFSE